MGNFRSTERSAADRNGRRSSAKRCAGTAGLRSSGLSRADRQDQRHVGFTPRDEPSISNFLRRISNFLLREHRGEDDSSLTQHVGLARDAEPVRPTAERSAWRSTSSRTAAMPGRMAERLLRVYPA